MTTIVSASASQALAGALARELEAPLAGVDYDRFPDGELFVSLTDPEDVRDERVVLVGATASSDAHIELLLLQDAVREAGAEHVVTVIPYMGYGRQDKAFEAGQPVSARAVARAISTGADDVVVVNPHEDAVCDFFEPRATPVDAAGVLAGALPADLTDPVFLSPDSGAIELAETVRDAYGDGETDYFQKIRRSGTDVEITPSDVEVAGRDVVVTDDIIATGGTMSEAVSVLHEREVGRVFVTCVHPLLVRSAHSRLSRAGVEAIYGTDTLERPVSRVSVAPALADVLGTGQ
ncbi:ribose-phosphate diphosphokinase [Natrialbaceae archaeon A-chndr2]